MVWYMIQPADPVAIGPCLYHICCEVVSLLDGVVKDSMPMDQTFSKLPSNGDD